MMARSNSHSSIISTIPLHTQHTNQSINGNHDVASSINTYAGNPRATYCKQSMCTAFILISALLPSKSTTSTADSNATFLTDITLIYHANRQHKIAPHANSNNPHSFISVVASSSTFVCALSSVTRISLALLFVTDFISTSRTLSITAFVPAPSLPLGKPL